MSIRETLLSLVAVLTALSACGVQSGVDLPDAGAPPREVEADVAVAADGFSAEVPFTVPEATRSVTIVVTGADTALYGLGSLRTGDGIEHVGIALGTPPGPAMRASYSDEQIGQMPGELFQSIRLGTFTQIYPYRPGQVLPPGPAVLRVASDQPGPVHVQIVMPPEDGARTLHLNLIAVSDSFTFPMPLTFLDEAQAIFDQVGVHLVVDDVVSLPGTGLASITDFTEPQETPGSMTAMLPALVETRVSPGALDVFVVDALPAGVGGLSLGTPGPPRRGSYYYGVVLLRSSSDAQLARVLAHETCHFLALQHVSNTGVSGMAYADPLDDTTPGQGNLMEDGTTLTPDQAFAVQRSALLARE